MRDQRTGVSLSRGTELWIRCELAIRARARASLGAEVAK
jgi:hypothetical protein